MWNENGGRDRESIHMSGQCQLGDSNKLKRGKSVSISGNGMNV